MTVAQMALLQVLNKFKPTVQIYQEQMQIKEFWFSLCPLFFKTTRQIMFRLQTVAITYTYLQISQQLQGRQEQGNIPFHSTLLFFHGNGCCFRTLVPSRFSSAKKLRSRGGLMTTSSLIIMAKWRLYCNCFFVLLWPVSGLF